MPLLSQAVRKKVYALLTAVFLASTFLSFYVSAIFPISTARAETRPPMLLEDFEDLNGLGIHFVNAVAGSVKISQVNRPDPVVHGLGAVKLEYDFTGQGATSAAYLRFNNESGAIGRPLEGEPRRLGFWLHGDESRRWVRAQIRDSAGSPTPLDVTSSGGQTWNGWRYVSFNIPSGVSYPIRLEYIYIADTATARGPGELIFDDLTVFYDIPTAYELKMTGLTPLDIGQTRQAEVYATYLGSTAPERVQQGVTFQSSNPAVATVSSQGSVTAISEGVATITATMNNSPTASYELVVRSDAAPNELFIYGSPELERRSTERVKLFAEYADSSDLVEITEANYTSSNTNVATVNNRGVVTAQAVGETTISASFGGLNASYILKVIEPVPVVLNIQLSGLSAMNAGQTLQSKVEAEYNLYEELIDVTGEASYTSSRPQIASISSSGQVTAHTLGTTLITASFGGRSASQLLVVTEDIIQASKREMRSAWIATVENIDWPKKVEKPNEVDLDQLAEQQKAEYIQILDDLKSVGMNAIIMQIKPTADSFYPSEYGPWSEWLTGIQGRDPGYDPLEFMIEEAHKRNLEFHAWFNPYRISMHSDFNRLSADHPLRNHRDWIVTYGGRLLLDPGIPEAQEYIINSVMEVVAKYDIDAVQFDDYFYPYPVSGVNFPDQQSYETYGKGFDNVGDWRRDNVNTFIQDLAAEIKKEKAYVKFGISPFGIWRNKASDPTGSDTNGLQNYDALYADTRKWIEEEWIDYIAPQNYWHFGNGPAAYEVVTDWWDKELRDRGSKTHLYIGQASYRIGAPGENPAWMNPAELPTQLNFNRHFNEVKGSMFFNTNSLQDNRLGFSDRLRNDIYATPALIPVMDWLPQMVYQPPTLVDADSLNEGIQLTWEDDASNDSTYYVIYRAEKGQMLTTEDPRSILSIVRPMSEDEPLAYVDTDVSLGSEYTYAVTAVDRLHNESGASNPVSVTYTPAAVTGIAIEGLSDIPVGDELQALIRAFYEDGSSRYVESGVVFSSSDTSVATIDSDGWITALAPGDTTITAEYEGFSDSFILTVAAKISEIKRIVIEGLDDMEIGDELQAIVRALYEDESESILDSGIIFSSSDTSVATIDSDGLVIALAPGVTIITAEYEGFSDSFILLVTTAAPVITGIAIEELSDLVVGDGQRAWVRIFYEDKSESILEYGAKFSSSDSSIVTIDSEGWITALTPGVATITAEYAGFDSKASITVFEPTPGRELERIQIEGIRLMEQLSGVQILRVYGLYTDGFKGLLTDGVHLTSSNSSVASVDNDGRVQAHSNGTTVITATYGSLDDKFEIQVALKKQLTSLQLKGLPQQAPLPSKDYQASVIANYNDSSTKDVTAEASFSSSNPDVASVTEKGLVTIHKKGTATIKASLDGVAAQHTIQVTDPETPGPVLPKPTGIDLEGLSTIRIGQTRQAEVFANYDDGKRVRLQTADVQFATSDSRIATVSSSGLVTAVSRGDVVITATWKIEEQTFTASYNLRVNPRSSGGYTGPIGPIGGGDDPGSKPGGNIPEDTQVIGSEELASIANGKLIVTLSDGKSKLQFSADLVERLGANGQLILQRNEMQLTIPSAVLSQLLNAAAGESLDGAIIIITAAFLEDEQSRALLTRAEQTSGASLQAIGSLWQFALELKFTNGEALTLSRFNEPVEIQLPAEGASSPNLTNLYYIDASGNLRYIAGEWSSDGSALTASLDHFSTYAVLQYMKSYQDVAENHWAAGVIRELSARQIVQGISASQFSPEQRITRAEFAALLVRVLGLQASAPTSQFADVSASDWFALEVTAAYQAGLINGVSEDRFDPQASLTREQMAAMLVRAYEHVASQASAGSDSTERFADYAEINAWAQPYVNQAAAWGLLQGQSGNRFAPASWTTRAESAQAIFNLLQ